MINCFNFRSPDLGGRGSKCGRGPDAERLPKEETCGKMSSGADGQYYKLDIHPITRVIDK